MAGALVISAVSSRGTEVKNIGAMTGWMHVTAGGFQQNVTPTVVSGGEANWFSHRLLGASFTFTGYMLSGFNPRLSAASQITYSDGTTTWIGYSVWYEGMTIARQELPNGGFVMVLNISGFVEKFEQI